MEPFCKPRGIFDGSNRGYDMHHNPAYQRPYMSVLSRRHFGLVLHTSFMKSDSD